MGNNIMKYLSGEEEKNAEIYIEKAVEVARKATCRRAKCGAVIVKDGEIIGTGFNSPPGENESERRCEIKKSMYDRKVTDKTCCVHAEQRAIMDALRRNPEKLIGSTLYFARFHPNGEQRFHGGEDKLYCTICTKMMLDTGIAEFILPCRDGICVYPAGEYNRKSFDYKKL